MGKTLKDRSLHDIATLLCEVDAVRERVCGNIYMGERAIQLLEATHQMQAIKESLAKEKKGERLTQGEKQALQVARDLQHEIITVDAFKHDEYFARTAKRG